MIGNGGLIFRVGMRVPCIAEWARECERAKHVRKPKMLNVPTLVGAKYRDVA